MKTRAIVGCVGMIVSAFGVSAGGCVSNNPAAAPPDLDSGPLEFDGSTADSAIALDSSVSDARTPVDSTVPTDSGQPADGADSALPQALVRFGIFFTPESGLGPQPQRGLRSNGTGLPAYDVCVAPHGTGSWQGPLLASVGLAAGLSAFQVSSYFSVPAGQNDVLIIPAGGTCEIPDAGPDGSTPSVFEITNAPAVPAGATVTVGLGASSSMTSPYAAVGLLDEKTATSGNVAMRYASFFGPSVFGLGGGIAFDPLFSVTGTQVLDPTADSNGYREIAPIASIDTSIEYSSSGYTRTILGSPLALPAGAVVSVFGGLQEGDTNYPVLITCIDSATPTTPGLSNCTSATNLSNPLPAASFTRFASFLSDTPAPAVDVCIRYHGLPSFIGPILNPPSASDAGADAGQDAGTPLGLAPPTSPDATATPLSGYFSVHGGFQYDVRLVTAGSTSCAIGLGADDLFDAPLASGDEINTTLAATGFLSVPADAGEPSGDDAGTAIDAGPDGGVSTPLASVALTFETFVDENYATPAASARIIHLAASYPQPLYVSADGNAWGVSYIPYGAFGTPGVDVNGYQQVPAVEGNDFIVLYLSNGNQAIYSDYSSTTNEADTFFLYQSSGQMIVTQCPDSTYAFGGIWTCSILPFGG